MLEEFMEEFRAITVKELKDFILKLENENVIDDATKIFVNTGWDSVQELLPNAMHAEKIAEYVVRDEISKDEFFGWQEEKKESKFEKTGKVETALIFDSLV
jgi:hypothetical protein